MLAWKGLRSRACTAALFRELQPWFCEVHICPYSGEGRDIDSKPAMLGADMPTCIAKHVHILRGRHADPLRSGSIFNIEEYFHSRCSDLL